MEKLWLGIDAGTTAIKAGVYRPDGVRVAFGEAPGRVDLGPGGQSEQDMDAVWSGVCRAIRLALEQVDPSVIGSIGIAAQGDGLWALDANYRPVGPAMLWNDTRASTLVGDLYGSGRAIAVSHACHTSIWPGTAGTLYQWLRENRPGAAERIRHVIYCADWIGYNLTGMLATDYADASIPFMNLKTRDYDPAALDALGSGPLAQFLCRPRVASERLGSITHDAARATGLPAGLPVSVGTMDLSAMLVGMGMEYPGETMMILGTTAVVNILTEAVQRSDLPVGATAYHANGKTLTRILAPTTGAAALDWFCALHPASLGGTTATEVAGKLNALCETVPPGANGVTFLPYLNGERAPFVSPAARATFAGLTSASNMADMGRAVMEGAAFSLRHCFEAEGSRPTQPVRLTGGGARSALWCQIISDVMQVPIIVSAASDHGIWGAACIGAAAAGAGNPCDLARRDETTVRYDPDPSTATAYDAAFNRYLRLSSALQANWNS